MLRSWLGDGITCQNTEVRLVYKYIIDVILGLKLKTFLGHTTPNWLIFLSYLYAESHYLRYLYIQVGLLQALNTNAYKVINVTMEF